MRRLFALALVISAAPACRDAPTPSVSVVPADSKANFVAGTGAAPIANEVLADVKMGDPLSIRLHGEGPFRFGFDTGQSVSVLLSPALALRLALPVVDHIDASDGTSSLPVDVIRVDSVELGGVELGGQTSIVMQPGTDVDGALGFPLFSGLLVELDYAAGRLRIRRGELPEPDGLTVLPITSLQGIPMVPITIGRETMRAVLDSGSEADLLIPLSMADRLSLEAPPQPSGRMKTLFGEFEFSTARLHGRVRLGGIELVDPELTLSDHFSEVNVGGHFLSRFRVTFDPARNRVRFQA